MYISMGIIPEILSFIFKCVFILTRFHGIDEISLSLSFSSAQDTTSTPGSWPCSASS